MPPQAHAMSTLEAEPSAGSPGVSPREEGAAFPGDGLEPWALGPVRRRLWSVCGPPVVCVWSVFTFREHTSTFVVFWLVLGYIEADFGRCGQD